MQNLKALWNDEAGFIVSAELVLIATICVLGLVVGLSEVQHAIVSELNDVADAIGSLNQTFCFSGFSARKRNCRTVNFIAGSCYKDNQDDCDNNSGELACDPPSPECHWR